MKYVITVDWYNDDEGHNIQVLLITDDFDKALVAFREYVDAHRDLDENDGYTIQDDYNSLYYAYGRMPEYHRVQINNYGG